MNSSIKRGQGLFFASAALILLPRLYRLGQQLWEYVQGLVPPWYALPGPIFLLFLVLLWFAFRGRRFAKVSIGVLLLILGGLGMLVTLRSFLIGIEQAFVPAVINWRSLLSHLGFSIAPALLLLFAKPITAFQRYQREGRTDWGIEEMGNQP